MDYYPERNYNDLGKPRRDFDYYELPLIQDRELDSILDITKVTYFKMVKKDYLPINPLRSISFECSKTETSG
jgi:hypothetical protein